MAKMNDGDLRALLESEYTDALAASNAAKLSGDRSDALNYYLGDMSKDMPNEVAALAQSRWIRPMWSRACCPH